METAKFTKYFLAAMAAVMFAACGGGGGGGTTASGPTPPPEPTVITHNGTTYDTVTSPFTGKVWLDRNLGAAQVCTALNDTACYGDYYQWGRNFDGHQDSLSDTTVTLAQDVNNVGNEFITTSVAPFDWTSIDEYGLVRSTNWSATDGSSVCPVGFRVPTIMELRDETVDASTPVTSSIDAFNNFLKLPTSGGRDATGTMTMQGATGHLWSSSIGVEGSYYLLTSLDPKMVDIYRVFGFPVRCIQN